MKQMLFTYAVILHSKLVSEKGGTSYISELIIEPTTVLAKSEKDVVFKITRLIPAEHAENPDDIEILVRPF